MRKGTVYRMVVRSELTDKYASAFEGMSMETHDGQTILMGEIVDQPHLFGILDRINGLGLELLSVQAMPEARPEDRKGSRSKTGTGSLATSSAQLIHRSAWKVNSPKLVCRMPHSPARWPPYGRPEISRLLKVDHDICCTCA